MCATVRPYRSTLAWQPMTSLSAGLDMTIAYFDRLLSGQTGA